MFPNSNTSISARSCSCRSPAIGLLTYRCNLAFGFKVIRLQLTFYTRLQKTNLLENCNYFATAKEQFRSSTNLGKKNIILEISLWTIYSLEVSCIKSKLFIFFTNNGEISNRWQSVISNLERAIFLLECISRKKNQKKMRSFQTGEKIFNGKKQFYLFKNLIVEQFRYQTFYYNHRVTKLANLWFGNLLTHE